MATNCNCCCGCKKAFTLEELAYYAQMNGVTETTLCFDCQEAYERETSEKEQADEQR